MKEFLNRGTQAGYQLIRQTRMPTLILIFFIIDLTLGIAYLCDVWAGQPYAILTLLLHLDREGNLPTWYSSMQWFCVAILIGIFAHRNFNPSQRSSWLLLTLPLLFLGLSLDEVAQIHEWLGQKLDVFLPGGSRTNSPFSQTGIWMFLIGLPFLALVFVLIFSIRTYCQRAPGAIVKMLLGMTIMLVGAIGIETLTNLVAPKSLYGVLQVFSEELCEMLGGTMVLWGSYELLHRYGFALSLAKAETDESASPQDNSP